MSGASDRLDRDTHDRIFREVVRPKSGLDGLASHERPKAIILGGQPGSGKGGLERAARAELNGDGITIDPDQLWRYHPSIREFRAAEPYSWSGRTHRDASGWANELREAAVAGKKNVVIDTTLGDGRRASKLIGELRSMAITSGSTRSRHERRVLDMEAGSPLPSTTCPRNVLLRTGPTLHDLAA